MNLSTFTAWFSLAVGLFVIAMAPIGLGRAAKISDGSKRRRKIYFNIGNVFLGISFILSGVSRLWFLSAFWVGVGEILFALAAVGFYLRGYFVG